MSEGSRKKFKCPICAKGFTKPHTVKVHMRLHTGQRPHECHLCTKTFVTSSALKDHLISHVSIRDFMCNLCGSKFKHKGTLKRHQGQHEEYDRKRDQHESIETAVVYESQIPYEQPDTKYFILSVDEAREKFPEIQDLFDKKSLQEVDTQAVISNADCDTTVVKKENLSGEEIPYGATVLELTEDKVYDQEGINVRVYNVSGELQDPDQDPLPSPSVTMVDPLSLSQRSVLHRSRASTTVSEEEAPSTDIAVGFGSHVSRLLSLMGSEKTQAALIQRLNKTIHTFIVSSRK